MLGLQGEDTVAWTTVPVNYEEITLDESYPVTKTVTLCNSTGIILQEVLGADHVIMTSCVGVIWGSELL